MPTRPKSGIKGKPRTKNVDSISHPDYYQARIDRIIQKNREPYRRRVESIKQICKRRVKWRDCVSLKEYDVEFEPLIHMPLENFARELPKRKEESLRVFEDGMGKGIALMELVSNLRSIGIECEGSGTTLEYNKTFQSGNIKIIGKPTEKYLLDKKQHLIISKMGGLSYSLQPLKKDTFLKLLYSLEKGGVLLASLSWHIPDFVAEDLNADWGIDLKGDKLFRDQVRAREDLERNIANLKQALRKRGFDTIIAHDPEYKYGLLVYVKRL